MHGGALVFMATFWMLVIGLVVFVFCRLYCPGNDFKKTAIVSESKAFDEPEEVT